MRNCYLHITELPEGKFRMTYCDGMFSAVVAVLSKEELDSYCDKKAVQWETDYTNVSIEDRKVIAEKWRRTKDIPAGTYDFYFNLLNNQENTNLMTRKQKAKAYDEALKKAKTLLKEMGNKINIKTLCEYIFPELKEKETKPFNLISHV